MIKNPNMSDASAEPRMPRPYFRVISVFDKPVSTVIRARAQPSALPMENEMMPANRAILTPATKQTTAPKNMMTSVVTRPTVFQVIFSQVSRSPSGTRSRA